MPVNVQETLNIALVSLQVTNRLLGVVQKLIPPGPPNYPDLTNIATLAATVQATATQIAANGGTAPGGGGGTTNPT